MIKAVAPIVDVADRKSEKWLKTPGGLLAVREISL
jgi:hypothetical protein